MKETITNTVEDNLEKIKPIVDELQREEVHAIYLFGSHGHFDRNSREVSCRFRASAIKGGRT